MKDVIHILVVEDVPNDYELAQHEILRSMPNCIFMRVEKQIDFIQALGEFQPDIILSDYQLPSFTGLDTLELVQQYAPTVPFIIWTGAMSEDVAVECLKKGASNYVIKDNLKRLGPAILRALEERQVLLERDQAQAESRAHEEELRTITEQMTELICRFKPDGTLTYVNSVYCEYFGKSREELIGTSFIPLGAADFPQKHIDYFKSFSPEHPIHTFEQYDYLPDGTKRWREWMDRGFFNDNGELTEIQSLGRDITKRKEAEERYQTIFENSPVGIFQSTPEGRFISVNPAMARIYGYASPEEMTEGVIDIASNLYLSATDHQHFLDLLHETGVVNNFEMMNRKRDGKIFWTSTSARIVRDAVGQILYYEGFLQDITESKQAGAALKNNEMRFRALIENGLDDISLLDRDGNLLWESPSTIRNLGYEPNQFVGQDIFKLMHPDDLIWVQKLFVELIQKPGSRQHQLFRLQRSDGTWRWVEAITTNMLEEPGVQAIVVNYRDVTENKQAEQDLRESEEKYRLLFESNPLPMWIYDLETLKFLKVNDAAVQHYGYSVQDFLGMTIKDIRPIDDVPKLLENIAQSAQNNRQPINSAGVWRHRKKDGTVILVDIISHVVNFEGIKAELVLANDVTERKQAETELQHRTHDLALVAALNDVINRGESLDAVVELMTRELKLFSSGGGVTIYLLNPDGKSLEMQQYFLPPETSKKIEKLIGREIPRLTIPIQKGGYFEEVITSKRGRITTDPQVIQNWMREFVETDTIPALARGPIRKLIPQIFKLLNIKSTILMPLIWEGSILGLLDVSSPMIFSENDLHRIENIGGQLTTAIRRKQVEDTLKKERNLLRTLIDNLPDRIYVMDAEGRKTLSNTADWKASGGKTMEDVIGKTDFDMYPPELAEPFWQLDKAVLESGQPVINYEEPGLDFDGNTVSILTTKIPLRNDQGQVIGLVGVGRDITNRKRAEAQINDLLVFNEKILNSSPVGILTYKFSGECVFANEQAALIVGTQVADLKQQNFHQIESWKRSGLYDLIEKTIQTQTPGMTDVHHLSTFGRDIWMTVSCTTFRSRDEDHILLSISDITERKKAEQALRESQTKYQNLVETSHDLIWAVDSHGTITFLNRAAKQIYGYEPEELIGHSFFEMMDPAYRPQTIESWEESMQGISELQAVEAYVRHRDGRQFILSANSIVNRDSAGNVVNITGSSRDITENKRVELERQVLLEIMQGLARTNDLQEFIKLIHTAIAQVIYAKNFFVVLQRQDTGLFEEIYSVDQYDPPAEPSMLEKSITSYVFHSGEPLLLTGEGFNELVKRGDIELVGTDSASWLGVPLKTANQNIGVMAVQDYQDPNLYTERDKNFLTSIASQVALAIERKRSEEELQTSNERFYFISKAVNDAVWDWDFASDQVNWNDSIHSLFGYQPDQVGMDSNWWVESIHPEDRERVVNSIQGVIDSAITNNWQSEYRYKRADRSYAFVFDRGYVIRNELGKAIRMVGAMQDITERKRVEEAEREQRALAEALRDSAESLTSTLDYGEVLDRILDAVGRVVPHSAATIMLLDGHQAHVVRAHGYYMQGLYDEVMGIRLPLAETDNLREMMETQQPVIVYDTHASPGWKRLSSTEWLRSIVGAPICLHGQVIGFILLDSATVGFFTPIHAERLEAFANQAAIAIHNSHLLQQARDEISERKRAEEIAQAERGKAQNYLDIAGVMLLALDHNGIVTLINQKGCEVLGYSNEEIIGKNWIHTFLPEETRTEMQEAFEQLLAGNTTSMGYYENSVLTKSGEQRLIAWHNTVLRDNQGMIISTLSSGEDITERKWAENELRDSEERFRQLVNNMEEVFWMTDAETGQELYVSPAGEKIWGLSQDDLLHQPNIFISSVYPEDRPLVTRAIEAERQGDKVEMEYRILHPDGKLHWVWDRAFPIRNSKGVVTTLAGIAADITDRKKAEFDIRRHLAELEALYENGLAVGQLLKQDEIGHRLIETFGHYLSWHHVTIRLVRPGTDELELVAFSLPGISDEEKIEMEQHFNKMIHKIGQGLSGWAVQTGEPLRTGNVHDHPQYVDTHAGITSGLYMPLKLGNRVIGCISVESQEADAFTANDERLLATLANQAAVAFENARLYQAVQVELTERKRMEDAVRTSEAHYRELADSITDILFELDHNVQFTHWNKASELLTGLSVETVIGRSIIDVMGTSATVMRALQVFEEVLNTQQSRIFEISFSLKHHRHTFEVNAYPSTRGVSVVAKDITERKQNEILLEKRFELMEYAGHHNLEEMMQKTIDLVSEITGSHMGFYFFVDDDQKTLTMQTCSTETIQSFNVPDSQGLHVSVDQAGVWAEAARLRRPIIHNDYESLPVRKGLPDGHVPIVRELAVPIIRNEKLVSLVGIGNKDNDYTQADVDIVERFADYAWDITERKQMEVQLAQERIQLARRVEERTIDLSRANSNLARALRVKDEFLANMSHELRTPLNAILGLSESLGEQVAGPLNEKQQKYLTTINESGHHLLSLINDILDLAKIEAGQITLDINKVDINAVCQASLRMVKQLAQKKNQDVHFQIDSEMGLMWADERRLKQMIVNLLSNAVKFTPESGSLGLEVHGDRIGNKVIITVWDRGIGITQRDLERLFKPFVQLDSGLAREVTGTGLGLALVAQMARLHGGSVNVESQPGEGSRFSIQLPWEPALASDAAIRLRNTGKFSAINLLAKHKPTILLIEDTKEVVMMVTDYLEMAGFKIITAQDGVDGIAQAKLGHPDLILMDIQMPRMDGFETTQKLRSDPEFKDTPIIALTALAMFNDREKCLAAGMNEYLSKPINLKALVKMIRQFLFENKESTPQ